MIASQGSPALEGLVSVGAFHVGIEVPDIDEGLRFYRDVLGFEEAWRINPGSGELLDRITGIRGLDETAVVQLVVPGGVRLELQQYKPQGTVGACEVNNQGINHLSFGVPNVRAAYERLSAAGVKFRSEPVDMPDGLEVLPDGWAVVYFEDPWGTVLELLGPSNG